jgi:hypothetical protein
LLAAAGQASSMLLRHHYIVNSANDYAVMSMDGDIL